MDNASWAANGSAARLLRLQDAITRQKDFILTVPDPDNRARAESNLSDLVDMREALTAESA